ncbi:MAG: FCD domain-containing protein [Microvirga sp.]|nr:FCD domain-containing protein [Microvirga sp.]
MTALSTSRRNAAIVAPKIRRYRQIADALKDAILSGAFKAGDRLPTERELATRYSVSRNCVREALLALEIWGFVSIQVGSGVYVLGRDGSKAASPREARTAKAAEVLEARLMFEPEVCATAAARAGPDDLARLHATHALMQEPSDDVEQAGFAYREFHLGLVKASGNPIAVQLMRDIWRATQVEAWVALRAYLQRPELQTRWRDDHAAILEALEDRHRGRARAAMRAHIATVFTMLDEADLV